MRWQHIKAIYLKELMDTVRDRKTFYVMILVPLILMPVLIMLGPILGQQESKRITEQQEEGKPGYQIVLVGEEEGPSLAKLLKETTSLEVVTSTNPEKDLKEGNIHTIVTFPKDFEESIKNEIKSEVEMKYEATNRTSDVARLQVMNVINTYSQQVVSNRLIERGLEQEMLYPLEIKETNVASDEAMGGMFLGMILPFIIVMWAIMGGMYTAIDVGAGEKERGTLESLLVTPPDRKSLVLGKFLSIFTVCSTTIALALTSMVLTIQFLMPMVIDGEEAMKISLPFDTALIVLLMAFLTAAFMSALQLALSIYARSFKEAQNYITPLYLGAMVPAMIVQFMPTLEPTTSLFAVPVLNTTLVLKELFMGNMVWDNIGVVIISNIAFVILSLRFAFRTFNKEKVLFRT